MNQSLLKTMLLIVAMAIILDGGLCVSADEPAVKSVCTNTPALTEAQLDELFAKAVVLHKYHRYDEAAAAAIQILVQKPDNRDAQQLLNEITRARTALGLANDQTRKLKKKLDDILVSEINVRDADVRDVVKYLRDESGRLSPDKTPVNFVWQIPADEKLPLVSMQFRKIPMSDAIRYMLAAAGLTYRVEPHAVVIYRETPQPAPNVKSQ